MFAEFRWWILRFLCLTRWMCFSSRFWFRLFWKKNDLVFFRSVALVKKKNLKMICFVCCWSKLFWIAHVLCYHIYKFTKFLFYMFKANQRLSVYWEKSKRERFVIGYSQWSNVNKYKKPKVQEIIQNSWKNGC